MSTLPDSISKKSMESVYKDIQSALASLTEKQPGLKVIEESLENPKREISDYRQLTSYRDIKAALNPYTNNAAERKTINSSIVAFIEQISMIMPLLQRKIETLPEESIPEALDIASVNVIALTTLTSAAVNALDDLTLHFGYVVTSHVTDGAATVPRWLEERYANNLSILGDSWMQLSLSPKEIEEKLDTIPVIVAEPDRVALFTKSSPATAKNLTVFGMNHIPNIPYAITNFFSDISVARHRKRKATKTQLEMMRLRIVSELNEEPMNVAIHKELTTTELRIAKLDKEIRKMEEAHA